MRGARPYELVATAAPERLVAALVRNLAEVVGGQATYGLPAGGSGGELTPIESWPRLPAGRVSGTVMGDVVREPVAGGGVVLVAGPKRWGDGEYTILRETAAWLGLAARLDGLSAEHDRAAARAGGLRAELAVARERLAQVRDLERRRLVKMITTTTLRDLDEVRQRLRTLAAEGAVDDELAAVRGALDDLIDNFRTVVRGVYPAMLPDLGPRAALDELAATLPRPVRFDGDLGRRVGWQVESGLYHAVAAVLNALAGSDSAGPIEVHFDRDDTLRVRITAAAGGTPEPELRAALGHDAERLAVLGGTMECAVVDGSAVVTVRLPERIEPVADRETAPSPHEHNVQHQALYRRVRDLVRQGQDAAGPDRARWDAVAERLASPARLAVVGGSAAAASAAASVATVSVTTASAATASAATASAATASAPESTQSVTVIAVAGPADQALAEEFLADDGLRGAIDAVLCLIPPAPAFRAALLSGQQRVTLTESASVAELARKLVVRGPVIAARRAMVTVTELVRGLPTDHPLQWAVDRTRALAHEIAELDLLDALEYGDPRLLRGASVDAARLLGAHGADAPTRLGLAAGTDGRQVRAAAEQAAARWRAHAEHPATSGRDRMACEVLVRTAEGLLTAERTP
jgi:hypothetical protein